MKNTAPTEPEPTQKSAETDERTTTDFGDQWTAYQDNSGHCGSLALLADIFGPLLTPAEIAGMHVAEIGFGTGRIVNMLLDAGAAHITAVEPSRAFDVLARNTAARSGQVRLVRGRGKAHARLHDQCFRQTFARQAPVTCSDFFGPLIPGGRLGWVKGDAAS